MAEGDGDILFLAGRLAARDEVRGLRSLVDGLARLGVGSRVACLGAVGDHGIADLGEYPGLGHRWRLPWASRALALGDGPARPRLIHALGFEMAEAALEVAERWRLPYLLTVNDFPRRNTRLRLSRAWCRGLVATSPELAGALARDFGVPSRSIRVVPRGIETPAQPEAPPSPGRVPVVGAAGPLVAGSGFPTFLNAARKVIDAGVDAEFLVAGRGEDEPDLRRRAERLGIADRLTFADDGAVDRAFWDVLDVYCQTSVAPTVGRSLALALAHGVPSIASDVEGLRSLVEDAGLRIAPGHPGALARAIVGLLADREAARLRGASARLAVLQAHDPEAEAADLAGLYRATAAGHAPEPIEAGVTPPPDP